MKRVIQEADKPNRNKRLYPKNLLEREADRWTKTFVNENRALLAKCSPSSSTVNLLDVVGKITHIAVENNVLVAEVEPLKVPGAEEMFNLLEEGKLHIRMAGMGSLKPQPDGTTLIGDDYELTALFLTDDPA